MPIDVEQNKPLKYFNESVRSHVSVEVQQWVDARAVSDDKVEHDALNEYLKASLLKLEEICDHPVFADKNDLYEILKLFDEELKPHLTNYPKSNLDMATKKQR